MKKVISGVVASVVIFAVAGLSSVAGASLHASPVVTSAQVQVPNATSVDVCQNARVGYAHCNALLRTLGPLALNHVASSSAILGDNGAYSPAYLTSAYNVAALDAAGNAGVGQIVAVVDAYSNPNLASDLAYYRNYFNLPACVNGVVTPSASGCVFEQVNEAGATAPLPAASTSWGVEEAIDVEMVSAICPNCQILVVEANTPSMTDLGVSVDTAVQLGANVVSNSFGSPEFAGEVAQSSTYYNHPGVTLVAAAGDSGYGVQFPAASPNVVAVGGTTLIQNSANGIRSGFESAWSGSGSGCSQYEPKPAWQHDPGCATRTVADLAAVANPSTGVWIYDTYAAAGLVVAGGTSVAAAVVSAIFALGGAGAPNGVSPAQNLYRNADALTVVSSGSNGSCASYLCDASQSVSGYNGPTGLGTPGGSPSSFDAFSPLGAVTPRVTLASSPVAPTSVTLPGVPSNVRARVSNASSRVAWRAPQNNGGASITRYVVFDGVGQWCVDTIRASAITSCVVTGLRNGRVYRFRVVAVNALGKGAPSSHSNPVRPSA